MKTRSTRGFTSMDMAVILAIGVLSGALVLATAAKVWADDNSTQCLDNLRRLGAAFLTFSHDHHGFLPYPSSPPGQHLNWTMEIIPYLRERPQPGFVRIGRLASTFYMQCPDVKAKYDLPGDGMGGYGPAPRNALESSRSYKMNANLRHWGGGSPNDFIPATAADVPHPDKFVMIGDGISLDYFASDLPQSSTIQFDNAEICMDVNMPTATDQSTQDTGFTCPALRHAGPSCNFAFVDGHAENIVGKNIITRLLGPPGKVRAETFPSEYVTATGASAQLTTDSVSAPGLYVTHKSAAEQGLTRNPYMPIYWSELPTLAR